MIVRPANLNDASQIAGIYNRCIETSHATFEIEPVHPTEMESRRRESTGSGYPFLIAEVGRLITGYAYRRQFCPRASHLPSIEVSAYIHI